MTFTFPSEKMAKLGIAGIFLFGSRAQGTALEASDYDFGILMKNKKVFADTKKKNEVYNALYDVIAPQIGKLANLDIVFADRADLQFRYHIVRDGQLLYLGDQKVVGEFIDRAIDEHADFAPYRKLFQAAVLARVPG